VSRDAGASGVCVERTVSRLIALRWASVREAFAHFVYGVTGYEFARHAVEMRHELEVAFMVVTFGDLVGVPILPPVYSLRLLPYVVPEVATWKRHLARRNDFWEKEEYDLHGL
jgi:hypothetical protein